MLDPLLPIGKAEIEQDARRVGVRRSLESCCWPATSSASRRHNPELLLSEPKDRCEIAVQRA